MSPKSLLGRAEAVSTEEEFLDGTCFQELLPDPEVFANPHDVKRVIFCTGKIFYDLAAYRSEHGIKDVAIIRIEQLYPFHRDMVAMMSDAYDHATDIIWCQEEPLNMGAWTYIWPRLEEATGKKVRYAGREAASSPAAGSKAMHYREQKALISQAFNA